jgi:hypothetical protein
MERGELAEKSDKRTFAKAVVDVGVEGYDKLERCIYNR